MTDKQNFEINALFKYGTFITPNVKDNDISVPNNQTIIDGIDVSGCEFIFVTKDKQNLCWRNKSNIKCKDNPNCYYKNWKRKEQECEELEKELHKNFEEKDKLHLIIDRLLEASGYDTNTASAEDFEDVYENMRYEKQQLDQLKAENEGLKKIIERLDVPKHEVIDMDIALENEKLKQTITEIKEIVEWKNEYWSIGMGDYKDMVDEILQIISEVIDE